MLGELPKRLARRAAWFAVAGSLPLALSAGCVNSHNASNLANLQQLAAFDMQCPQDQMQFLPLDENSFGYRLAYGVSGCGKRASYVMIPTGTWAQSSSMAVTGQGPGQPGAANQGVQPSAPQQASPPSQPDASAR